MANIKEKFRVCFRFRFVWTELLCMMITRWMQNATQYVLSEIVDPVRLSSRTSFSLELQLGLESIYLHPLVWEICICKQTSETNGCK